MTCSVRVSGKAHPPRRRRASFSAQLFGALLPPTCCHPSDITIVSLKHLEPRIFRVLEKLGQRHAAACRVNSIVQIELG